MPTLPDEAPRVIALASSPGHTMAKAPLPELEIVAGEGVVGDAHRGVTVKHRSRVAADPSQPNLRQVHLIHSELFDELRRDHGLDLAPAEMGENVTTRGIDLLGLSRGTVLHIGVEVQLEVTGLRNPCGQLNGVRSGLLAATRVDDGQGGVVRKAGIMCIVMRGGLVGVGDAIRVAAPAGPRVSLEPV